MNSEYKFKARTNSYGSGLKSLSNNNLENLILLNSIKINYPIYDIPSDLLRFIPDSQLKLIQPLLLDSSIIEKKKYSTNVDERNYLTVFEYKLNENNWIIWDYSTGYVFFTGLWKSCGNNKTDIVKLVENFPNLNNFVKRVRGGFLKIQGTWLPFNIVKKLAKNFCFNIRYCLIPIFGKDFPKECLKPNDPNFGKLIDLNSSTQILQSQITNKRKRRLSNTVNSTTSNLKKNRSKSDNFTNSISSSSKTQLLELEEILKASKSLHDLSTSPTSPPFSNHFTFSKPPTNFQYGGFLWSWNDENNLCIIGKHEEEVIIDDDEDPINEIIDPSIPKNYDGYDTIINAAHQLMNFHTGIQSNTLIMGNSDDDANGKKRNNKMDIDGLLS